MVLRLFEQYPIQSGVMLGMLTSYVFMLQHMNPAIIAILLAAIAGIYIGFAISDGRQHVMLIETTVASFFIYICIGVLDRGYLPSFLAPYSGRKILAFGFAAHGVWDYLHHNNHTGRKNALVDTSVKGWYPIWCAWIDFVIAAAIYFM